MHPSSIVVVELILKGAAIVGAAYGGATLLARSSAAHRSLWWLGAFVTLLLLPLSLFVRPVWTLPVQMESRPTAAQAAMVASRPGVAAVAGTSRGLRISRSQCLFAAFGCGGAGILAV